MDISLIHAGLAGGAALASLPVILHLFMKQKPKHVIFPALRLIRERQKRSRKKLRVKNWLLLIARMLLVALMALALARPRLYSQTSLGDQNVPVAVALIFDTSLSMGYKEKDKTRLDEAKEFALDQLKKMADGSQVFVIDSADARVPESLSPATARNLINALVVHPSRRPLNAALGQAYGAIAGSDRPRREVYVMTDLARSAWDLERPVEGLDKVRKLKPETSKKEKGKEQKSQANDSPISTYVLNLSPKETHNLTVSEAAPTVGVATQGESVSISAKIRSRGPAMTRRVDFLLDGVPREQRQITVPANGETEVKFSTPRIDSGTSPADASGSTHQGTIRLTGAPDPLEFDDSRYFTFKVQPELKALVVSDQAVDAEFITSALDPVGLPEGASRTCRVTSIPTSKFSEQDREKLSDYACIFLNNARQLSDSDWGRLNYYVHEAGKGLVIGLGDQSQVDAYNSPTGAQLMPASLKEKQGPKTDLTFGKVTDLTHPLFQRFTRELDSQIAHVPIYRYWSVDVPKEARILLKYSDGAPALIERSFRSSKTGRVLLWTTPLARRTDVNSPAAWNEFPLPEASGITFYVLMNQTVPYLAGTSEERLNFEAGADDAVLPIDPTRRFKNYIVQSADGKTTERLSPSATTDSLIVVAPQAIGHWTVSSSTSDGDKTKMGFSVNAPLAETEFVPLESGDLDSLFGKDGYKLAKDADDFTVAVNKVRMGQELFPWLMFLILMLVTLENLLANRFYRESPSRQPASAMA